jgi:hypothetical protein
MRQAKYVVVTFIVFLTSMAILFFMFVPKIIYACREMDSSNTTRTKRITKVV